ncbi:MAG: AmmeMemoRadiSam system protein B [Ardenticatenaceae bacterium]
MSFKPLLRSIDFRPVSHDGQEMLLLHDWLELTDFQLVIPPVLTELLAFCDGTRTIAEIYHAFCGRIGRFVDHRVVTETIARLDEACLLENERSRRAYASVVAEYRKLPSRPPAHAGVSYPTEADKLWRYFTAFGADDKEAVSEWRGRGVVSPHIDYHRGGKVYAKVWRRAAAAVKEADLVLIFGTDHKRGEIVTLTQNAYATPYGVLPTDLGLVHKLAHALGPDLAFASELNHREEHSIELSAVWLHHTLAGQAPCPMVPILCGSFHHFVMNGRHPLQDERLNRFIATLKAETAGKNVLAVASVDLAHVGPAFGDRFRMDRRRRQQLARSDNSLMQAIASGDANRFYYQIASIKDKNRICGFSSLYFMLRYLQNTRGTQIAYAHCPADAQKASLVSVCGMLLD